jgi:endonuclease/exonuclease/phosphatase (EEP) superfamily protein YafD
MKKQSLLDSGLNLFIGGILIVSLLGLAGKIGWGFDLFSHFRVQYLQLCLIPFAIALWTRRNKQAIALVLLVCFNYIFVLPLYFGKSKETTTQPIRAMLMNLNANNDRAEQVIKSITQANPDLLLLEEVTPQWAEKLAVLDAQYKYRIAQPQKGCFGIMLLSKVPLEHGQITKIGSGGVPSIVAEAYFPKGVVSLIGTHPPPPLGAKFSKDRNNQLAELATLVQKQNHPVLLIGDLNTTPWSPYFTQLLRDSGLKNSMKGFGHQPTWPRNHLFLRVPLDHLLHSPEIIIHNRWIGGNVGSDHFPVVVDFSLPQQ